MDNYYVFPDEDDSEYVSEKIITTHGEKEVYPIGAYSWTWTEVQ